jgi:hypothetical protein
VHESNCVGFVYYELGIIPEEKYQDCPKLSELLDMFEYAKKDAAEVVAVVAPIKDELTVIHIALIDHEKGCIRHRKGVGQPVIETSLFLGGLESYLRERANSELVYLTIKR